VKHKLRLGVIGAGSWAVASHLPNFAARPEEVEFVAMARKDDGGLLHKIQQQFGFQIASEDYRDVLDAEVDVCLISSPTSLHHEHAKAAMEAGAHVLVEKPFTVSSRDAWDLVATAERLERHLVVSFGWNYKPMVVDFLRVLEEHGGIGEVENCMIHMASVTRELLTNTGAYPDAAPEAVPEPRTWTDPALSGGGYGQAQLSHALGLALWLTGLHGESVFALTGALPPAPVELHDAVAIRYRGGAVGTLSGGSAHTGANRNKHQLEVRAIGSEGQMHVDLEREIAWLWRDGGKVDIRLDLAPDAGAYDCDGPPTALIDLALGRERRNLSPGELAARTVEVLEAVYRSAASGGLERVASGADLGARSFPGASADRAR
jgi:predicted dehydrogenase